jgi:hypothetical protein
MQEGIAMKKTKVRKLEKKRRAERERHRQKAEPLAYRGNKYKTDALVPIVFQTEAGIYESFVMSDRQMTDHDVRAALESLIRGIRGGRVPLPAQQQSNNRAEAKEEESLLVGNIRRHWDEYFAKEPFPGRDNLIGVLRTILASIDVWGNISPTSRGYLRYLEGFMGKLGVHCQAISPDLAAALEDGTADVEDFDADTSDADSELILAGCAWTQGADADAGIVFRALAEEMIAGGQAKEVSEACQQLIGEASDRCIIEELSVLSSRAQQRLEPAPSRLRNILHRFIGT